MVKKKLEKTFTKNNRVFSQLLVVDDERKWKSLPLPLVDIYDSNSFVYTFQLQI